MRQSNKRKMLIIHPEAGLGNRLYSLMSGLYYASEYDTKLHIFWEQATCCNIPFRELLEVPDNAQVHSLYDLGYKNKYAFKSLWSKLYLSIVKKIVLFKDPDECSKAYKGFGEAKIRSYIDSTDKCLLRSNEPLCDMEHLKSVVDKIIPAKEIRDRVDEIMGPYMDRRIIGIHVRRTDHELSIDYSPIEGFEKLMDEYKDEACFYFASDDKELVDSFSKKYNVIPHITFSDTISRNSKEGMKDAFVEMLCLSKCEKIFGSYESTYPRVAALIGNVEYKEVRKDSDGQIRVLDSSDKITLKSKG